MSVFSVAALIVVITVCFWEYLALFIRTLLRFMHHKHFFRIFFFTADLLIITRAQLILDSTPTHKLCMGRAVKSFTGTFLTIAVRCISVWLLDAEEGSPVVHHIRYIYSSTSAALSVLRRIVISVISANHRQMKN